MTLVSYVKIDVQTLLLGQIGLNLYALGKYADSIEAHREALAMVKKANCKMVSV